MYLERYNANPKQLKVGDCVIRALSVGLNKEWKKVYSDLVQVGLKMCRMPNDTKTFTKYLKTLGYEKEKMPRKLENNKRYTLNEFINDIAKNNTTYIISLASHLTVVRDKKIIDTWDCGYKCVGNYWII